MHGVGRAALVQHPRHLARETIGIPGAGDGRGGRHVGCGRARVGGWGGGGVGAGVWTCGRVVGGEEAEEWGLGVGKGRNLNRGEGNGMKSRKCWSGAARCHHTAQWDRWTRSRDSRGGRYGLQSGFLMGSCWPAGLERGSTNHLGSSQQKNRNCVFDLQGKINSVSILVKNKFKC